MLGSKSWDEWIAQYGHSHQHPINRVCHTIGIPLIAVSIPLFAIALFVDGLWPLPLAMFVVGWVLQFVGHHYEGKRPALIDNIFQAFIGPMFLVAETLVMMGQRTDLAEAMGDIDVTVE